jgi:CXXX repeat peptide maturase
MLKYLLVVLSESSTSFCHYEGRPVRGLADDLIPLDKLENAVTFALKNNLKVNFLYPVRKLNRAYDNVIDRVDHVKIVPFEVRGRYPQAILVIESAGFPATEELKKLRGENIILRLQRADLPKLSAFLSRLLPRVKRVNLFLTEMEGYGPGEFAEYRRQLEKVSGKLQARSGRKEPPELNVLTDRLVLGKMKNCDAGLVHLTVAPNGLLYLCPAFYYGRPEETLGEIRNEIAIGNRHLLELKFAPICRICDAYHCQRCVFLNKTLTLEVNTPSYQQCRLSHIEREASRLYLQKLKAACGSAASFTDIPEISYEDPFDVVAVKKQSIAEFKKL